MAILPSAPAYSGPRENTPRPRFLRQKYCRYTPRRELEFLDLGSTTGRGAPSNLSFPVGYKIDSNKSIFNKYVSNQFSSKIQLIFAWDKEKKIEKFSIRSAPDSPRKDAIGAEKFGSTEM